MSCLDVMYQVYGPPQPYFAAAYSPYHQVGRWTGASLQRAKLPGGDWPGTGPIRLGVYSRCRPIASSFSGWISAGCVCVWEGTVVTPFKMLGLQWGWWSWRRISFLPILCVESVGFLCVGSTLGGRARDFLLRTTPRANPKRTVGKACQIADVNLLDARGIRADSPP